MGKRATIPPRWIMTLPARGGKIHTGMALSHPHFCKNP
ncbi:hypothetical protein THTE_1901 [Thermogutta terrifontis]|uniref:Uncharacterized protein n=1 Tax=Thermogutta terrifontis TaxID=1331910 RepID=A0A286REX5_9BACT|nr:hypothetical protein THTE_1901 [Thermogutta terrifontis]